ncbi:MAG TPA: hypothetical protein VGF05_17960 [Bryobacteraceae bacterium]|jgi:hypothetical protein
MLDQLQNPQTVPFGELHTIGFLDDILGGTQRVPNDEFRQVGVLQRHRPQEQRLFLGSNPQGHPAIVFDRYSRHGKTSPFLYAFK